MLCPLPGTAEQGEKWEGWQLKIIFSYWKSKKGIKIHCKKRRDYNVSIENTTLKWSEKFLTMAVHCSSNVILLAIEYFIDSKRERQNIKLLSTQNNYSPSFGLKKLVIFFISSDKTDKKLCRSWKYKTHCRTKRRGGQGMAFDQGASRPQGTITAKIKAQESHKMPGLWNSRKCREYSGI